MVAEKLLLTVAEAAEHLGVGMTTVWKLLAAGKMRRTRVRGATRISRKEIERFIARNTG